MSDTATVIRLRAQARFYALSGVEVLDAMTPEEMASVYNGIGPEWFPDALRRAIDTLSPDLQCCALIHDIRYARGGGKAVNFVKANAEFEANGVTIAWSKYSWWDPRRYILKRKARAFAGICTAFGWLAFVAAGMGGRAS